METNLRPGIQATLYCFLAELYYLSELENRLKPACYDSRFDNYG